MLVLSLIFTFIAKVTANRKASVTDITAHIDLLICVVLQYNGSVRVNLKFDIKRC